MPLITLTSFHCCIFINILIIQNKSLYFYIFDVKCKFVHDTKLFFYYYHLLHSFYSNFNQYCSTFISKKLCGRKCVIFILLMPNFSLHAEFKLCFYCHYLRSYRSNSNQYSSTFVNKFACTQEKCLVLYFKCHMLFYEWI